MLPFIVYAIVFRPLDIIVYVGSTARTDNFERSDEHTRLCGGARRVTIAFAQSWFQPIINFFEFRELWRGECTAEQAKGIEQFFMNKHETKVNRPRSRESCVAHDIDLMTKGTIPRQLNIVNACTDDSIVEWAATRVAHDSAITLKLSPMEQARTNYAFEVQRIAFETEAAALSSRVISDCIDKYTSMPLNTRVKVSEFYTDLVRINGSLSVDDGMDVRRCCRAKLLAFNTDHHADETWSVEYAVSELRSIQIALGVPTLVSDTVDTQTQGCTSTTASPMPIYIVPAETNRTQSEALDELVAKTCELLVTAPGRLVTLMVCFQTVEPKCTDPTQSTFSQPCIQALMGTMRKLTDEVTWFGVGAPQDLTSRSVFGGTVRGCFESKGYTFERKKGGAAALRGEGASGWHIHGYALPEIVDAPGSSA
jgi:hypothetical protein